MISVSLCMIVKNEEDVLERCLKSVAGLVDEIIIVDTGSTDRTREIATHFTNQIFDFPWQDDFSAARNEAFSHASMDYCMWLVTAAGTGTYIGAGNCHELCVVAGDSVFLFRSAVI